MKAWPKAVLFDFDGVIANSEPLHFQAFRETLAAEKIDLTEEQYFGELIGFDDRGALQYLFAKLQRPLEPRTMLRILTRKSEAVMALIHRNKPTAMPGAQELVRALWRHYPLGICSGALREEIEAMLEGVALRDCFPIIVSAEDVTVGKPDPMGYLMCMKQVGDRAGLSLVSSDCLIVEDAPKVARSVKQVGFSVLAVASSHPMSALGDADYAVKTLRPEEVGRKIPQLKLTIG